MPSLATYEEFKPVKMLFIGDSGSGKTGALQSLAEIGYNIRILDFDNGLDFLFNNIKLSPKKDEILEKIIFQKCTDKLKAVAGVMMPDGPPRAFSKAMNQLTVWKEEGEEPLGPVTTWGIDDIIVIDSLTFMSAAAFRYVDTVNNYKDPRQTYGHAQELIESCLAMLYSDSIQCHVIVTSHITFVELDSGLTKGYPSSVGKALGPKIPRYFNTCLEAKTKGTGKLSKHVILTKPDGMIELKCSVPNIPAELPIETGLAEFFIADQGDTPNERTKSREDKRSKPTEPETIGRSEESTVSVLGTPGLNLPKT